MHSVGAPEADNENFWFGFIWRIWARHLEMASLFLVCFSVPDCGTIELVSRSVILKFGFMNFGEWTRRNLCGFVAQVEFWIAAI